MAALQAPDATLVGRPVYFGPVLDGDSLPRHPFYPDAPAQSSGIPMIIGNTRDETIAFLGNEPGVRELDWQSLPARLLPQLYVDIDPGTVIAEYRRLYPQYTPTQVYFAATTAGRSWRGAIIEAQLRAAQGSPAWVYQLDYRSPLEDGRYGAMHTMDIPLVFDNIRQPGSLTGDTPAAQRTADQMSAAFIAFARTGDPGSVAGTQWLRYEPEAARHHGVRRRHPRWSTTRVAANAACSNAYPTSSAARTRETVRDLLAQRGMFCLAGATFGAIVARSHSRSSKARRVSCWRGYPPTCCSVSMICPRPSTVSATMRVSMASRSQGRAPALRITASSTWFAGSTVTLRGSAGARRRQDLRFGRGVSPGLWQRRAEPVNGDSKTKILTKGSPFLKG